MSDTDTKIALIKDAKVDNIIVASADFVARADPRWKAMYDEFHVLHADARVATGWTVNKKLGAAQSMHDLSMLTAGDLENLYQAPPEPVPAEVPIEIVTSPTDEPPSAA